MKTRTRTAWRSLLVLLSSLLFSATSWAQGSIPFTIANNSPSPTPTSTWPS
ncbi:hypothetical protein [Hymenobacter cellulosilyticus]|uniref:Uncharacterized protein n=1 Tax=Hymenobacter cellulosilyticus TaxID=2932248 RepID=A0A8T9Q5Y3_9BACT|nr:hypothetical protein [Hymenobacter cellulosilyticus]UOQ72947.1 hypothetical protein MUN79_02885 [Hymenobacter cellulosilyticus]